MPRRHMLLEIEAEAQLCLDHILDSLVRMNGAYVLQCTCNRIHRTHSDTVLEIEAEVQFFSDIILDFVVCI